MAKTNPIENFGMNFCKTFLVLQKQLSGMFPWVKNFSKIKGWKPKCIILDIMFHGVKSNLKTGTESIKGGDQEYLSFWKYEYLKNTTLNIAAFQRLKDI